jgi:hypothetical protein
VEVVACAVRGHGWQRRAAAEGAWRRGPDRGQVGSDLGLADLVPSQEGLSRAGQRGTLLAAGICSRTRRFR